MLTCRILVFPLIRLQIQLIGSPLFVFSPLYVTILYTAAVYPRKMFISFLILCLAYAVMHTD